LIEPRESSRGSLLISLKNGLLYIIGERGSNRELKPSIKEF